MCESGEGGFCRDTRLVRVRQAWLTVAATFGAARERTENDKPKTVRKSVKKKQHTTQMNSHGGEQDTLKFSFFFFFLFVVWAEQRARDGVSGRENPDCPLLWRAILDKAAEVPGTMVSGSKRLAVLRVDRTAKLLAAGSGQWAA